MGGKKWFYWLGMLDGRARRSETRTRDKSNWPTWAQHSYSRAWYCGFLETSK